MIMYRLDKDCMLSITTVSVDKISDNSVWVRGTRAGIDTRHWSYFKTQEEAIRVAGDAMEKRINDAKARLVSCQLIQSRMNELASIRSYVAELGGQLHENHNGKFYISTANDPKNVCIPLDSLDNIIELIYAGYVAISIDAESALI